jgi:hypothetical protein
VRAGVGISGRSVGGQASGPRSGCAGSEPEMAKVTHFEIPADDPERAMTFQGELLGWSFHPWGGIESWLTQTGPNVEFGTLGAIVRREAPFDGGGLAAYVFTMNVEDPDAMLARVQELDGSVVGPEQAIEGIGWHAYARDTEGNPFGMMQDDETAPERRRT